MANLAETIKEMVWGSQFGKIGAYGDLIVRERSAADSALMLIKLGSQNDLNTLTQNYTLAAINAVTLKTSATAERSQLVALRTGEECLSIPNNFLYVALSQTSNPLADMYIDFNKVETIGSDVLSGNRAFNGMVLMPNVKSIGHGFMSYTHQFTNELRLPSSLKSIGYGFMYQCSSLESLYIEEGVAVPEPLSSSENTSLCVSSGSPAYVNGVVLKGPGAKVWKAALPDLNGPQYYRKLILDPAWA